MIKLNRQVMVRAWGTTKNSIGSPVASEVGAWKLWAEVEDRSGSHSAPYQQGLWQYDYKITVRYERSRVIGSNYTLDYDGKRLVINSIAPHSEGFKQYAVLRCSCVDPSVSTGGGGAVTPLPAIGVYNYTGVGDEFEFTAGILARKFVFSATKDGPSFKILRETGTPVGKEVLNIKATGRMLFGVPFQPDEVATILYI
jgi:SPP1 family predicted phage head-tail adaptor